MARGTKAKSPSTDGDGRPKSQQRVLSHGSLAQLEKEQEQKQGRRRGCCYRSEGSTRSRWRGPGPCIVLAALICLFASSTGGVALAAVLIARQRVVAEGSGGPEQEREAREALRDPAFYLARDLILFASAMAFLYIVLHVRAARRKAYCCVAARGSVSGHGSSSSSGGDGSMRDSCSSEEAGAADQGRDGATGSTAESSGSTYSMRTTMRSSSEAMRRTRLPPHLRGNYLHASALLVARLAIVVWIAALIATVVMIARAGPIPFRYADGTKKGFVGAVPVLNLLICTGAM